MDPDPWRALYAHLLSSMSEVKSDDLRRLRSRNLQGLRGLRRLRSLCVLVWSLDERLGRRHHGNHAEVVERETKAGCDAGATISPCCVPQRRYGPSRELEPMVDPLRLRAEAASTLLDLLHDTPEGVTSKNAEDSDFNVDSSSGLIAVTYKNTEKCDFAARHLGEVTDKGQLGSCIASSSRDSGNEAAAWGCHATSFTTSFPRLAWSPSRTMRLFSSLMIVQATRWLQRLVAMCAKERNLKTLNTLINLCSPGGVHDVFRSSALLEVGVFDTVAGPDLRGQLVG